MNYPEFVRFVILYTSSRVMEETIIHIKQESSKDEVVYLPDEIEAVYVKEEFQEVVSGGEELSGVS